MQVGCEVRMPSPGTSSMSATSNFSLDNQVEWKYIVIDEAQRMKDRESKLAKDLERFITSRRLLLTGAHPAPAY